MKRELLISLMLVSAAVPGRAATLLTGNFTIDDDVAQIQIRVAATGPVTIQTLSYAGGGFDPVLGLFDATGLLIALNDSGDSALPDAVTGFAWDAGLDLPALTPGDYILTLTQANNTPNGPYLADGFARQGEGNFTGNDLGIPGGSFLDISGAQRSSAWSVEFNGAEPVPEPATGLLIAAGLGLLRRMRRAAPALVLATIWIPHAGAVSIPAAGDATLRETQPASNFGALPQLTVDRTNSVLLSFGVAQALPAGTAPSDVVQARLILYVNRTLTPGSIAVYSTCETWTEATVTYATGNTTCNRYGQFVVAGSANFAVVDVKDIVVRILEGGNATGILLKSQDAAVIFDSKENSVSGQAPRLELTLRGPAGLPGLQGSVGPVGERGPAAIGILPAQSCGGGFMNGLDAAGRITCFCPASPFVVETTASISSSSQSWPGGQVTLGAAPCAITLNVPAGRIDATGSHSGWSVRDRGPYNSCQVIGRIPDCNTVAGIGRLEDGGLFPACSSSLGSTASTAVAVTVCR